MVQYLHKTPSHMVRIAGQLLSIAGAGHDEHSKMNFKLRRSMYSIKDFRVTVFFEFGSPAFQIKKSV